MKEVSHEPFGPTVERLMKENGQTYRSLAGATNLSAGYLNHLVHGNRPVPSDDVIYDIAKVLGVTTTYFMEYRIRQISTALVKRPIMVKQLGLGRIEL